MRGQFGETPPADDFLIIGHESLGRVAKVTAGVEGLSLGDWVVVIVRRPDPVPCRKCAAGEWDMCHNGRYTERGIKGRHGFLAEFYMEAPNYLGKVPAELSGVAILLEPLTVVEKAVEQIRRVSRAWSGSRSEPWCWARDR